ncbi:hypothetical protein SEA_MCSHANE_98 [Mycobacterium phage Mcshane]|uniref:Uncharacterized protein n=34 Tax=Pegunavirus TaxID=1623295 RepID=Q716I1_9CAUD|nr:hypothetical protein PBI_PG1_94 [Mycobacterium phage PG1]YP_009190152.1 hypothetical protein AU110_gp096 [Mycobacterium phage Badfish]YP_010096599.1 hypothetical protein KNT94_gp86 [Mycobacterium phage KingTut]AEO94002.1 hypothetical protein MURDOC_92 [Mycobacterium phage Murdoc]AER49209.1 hypothetical protein THREEOH3D2_97 [Mycobacterium phage ThreeOh3D2]AGC33845.1 hypothetical protein Serpentine_0098 [Mycobacterium phage Serpentine]AGC33955.1 hypothetical protein PIGLET_0095 [Mycobacteri
MSGRDGPAEKGTTDMFKFVARLNGRTVVTQHETQADATARIGQIAAVNNLTATQERRDEDTISGVWHYRTSPNKGGVAGTFKIIDNSPVRIEDKDGFTADLLNTTDAEVAVVQYDHLPEPTHLDWSHVNRIS